jgi:hypothetical protein
MKINLNYQEQKVLYKLCITQGVDVIYGKLSLCDLKNYRYSSVIDNRSFQVHSDDSKYPWSMIYDNLDSAVSKFIDLKSKVKRIK